MDKPFYNLLMNSPSNKVFGSAWRDGNVIYRLIVWMCGWNAFVLNVEDYTEQETVYRMYEGNYEQLERLLNYFGLSVDSDTWRILH
jgi:hypothetical protein